MPLPVLLIPLLGSATLAGALDVGLQALLHPGRPIAWRGVALAAAVGLIPGAVWGTTSARLVAPAVERVTASKAADSWYAFNYAHRLSGRRYISSETIVAGEAAAVAQTARGVATGFATTAPGVQVIVNEEGRHAELKSARQRERERERERLGVPARRGIAQALGGE